MKKKYVKPMVVVERFQLDGAIAASCSSDQKRPLNHGIDTCICNRHYYFSANCAGELAGGYDVVNTDENDTYCYHAYQQIIADSYFNS